MTKLNEIVDFVKNNDKIKIGKNFDISKYNGIISYFPEELVVVVKAGTSNQVLKKILIENNQGFNFYLDENKTIGASYNIGGSDIRDAVLGIQVIDSTGDILNFGGEVMKNVAGYDVSRLLCGAMGSCGIITQISFKILPLGSVTNNIKAESIKIDDNLLEISQQISKIFDKNGKFK